MEGVKALLCRLPSVSTKHFEYKRADQRIVYHLTMLVESRNQAKEVLDCILVAQKGGAWPPFAVSCGPFDIEGDMAPTNQSQALGAA
jgi:hypothetical protein